MIDGLKPYPAMKDSEVEWMKAVPDHWQVAPLGRLLTQRKEKNDPIKTSEILSLSLRTGVIPYSEKPAGGNKAKEDLSSYMLAYPGDIVVNSMNVVVGSVGLSRYFGAVSPVYYMLRPRSAHDAVEYFNQIFQASLFQRSLFGLGNGIMYVESKSGKLNTIRLRIPMTRLKTVLLPHPPPNEQIAIVRFLDHADLKIRRFIRAKQQLIALLNEQKQAVIHRAVTRGLDPNVRLKPSGNTWFPEIPKQWDVLPMRRLIRCAIDGPHHSPGYLDEGVPFLSARNIKVDSWSLEDAKCISEADYRDFCKRVTPEPGDVLYTKGGTTGVARVVDLTFPFQVWVHVAVLKIKKGKVTPDFLATALNTPRCYEQSQLFTRGATNQDLGLGRMKGIVLPVPPLSEQESIVRFAQRESGRLLSAIRSATREIELLREYRARLIADVVTGKLDVREAAARLPDELDEQDAADDELIDNEDVLDDARANGPPVRPMSPTRSAG